jgi:uncharacterized protein YciI
MYVVFLKFSTNRDKAGEFIEAHRAWVKRGFDDGIFLVVGSLQPDLGGAILAHNATLAELQERIGQDPFVVEDVAAPEIFEILPAKADERLQFLLG